MKKKRNIFSEIENLEVDPTVYGGVFSGRSAEIVSEHISSGCEEIISHGDVWIVLGRDRNAGRDSGYGGRGDARAFSLDIVVGKTPAELDETAIDAKYVDPNFLKDASRVFLSQKTNLDEYFGIREIHPEDNGKSGIGIKSDVVRVLSRQSMRIGTVRDEKNSKGGSINKQYGVELVAMDEVDKLQPMTLGQNVAEALQATIKLADQLSTIIDNFAKIQVQYLNSESTHFHYSPFNGLPTTPSEVSVSASVSAATSLLTQVTASIQQWKMNAAKIQLNFLTPGGEKSILSPLNKNN